MRRTFTVLVVLVSIWLVVGSGKVRALSYGNGVYTSLCGSGVGGQEYSCEADCDPLKGECRGVNSGVVRYECEGQLLQCSSGESGWSNWERLGRETACGKTVQLTVYNKRCRLDNGTWDGSCQLSGYMTWYSGDCYTVRTVTPVFSASPSAALQPSATISPTKVPIIVPTATQTPEPTVAVPITPTVTTVPIPTEPGTNECGGKCVRTSECKEGLACFMGYCRNPSCQSDVSCMCLAEASTESAAVADESPQTGTALYIVGALMMTLTILGWVLRSKSRELW